MAKLRGRHLSREERLREIKEFSNKKCKIERDRILNEIDKWKKSLTKSEGYEGGTLVKLWDVSEKDWKKLKKKLCKER